MVQSNAPKYLLLQLLDACLTVDEKVLQLLKLISYFTIQDLSFIIKTVDVN